MLITILVVAMFNVPFAACNGDSGGEYNSGNGGNGYLMGLPEWLPNFINYVPYEIGDLDKFLEMAEKEGFEYQGRVLSKTEDIVIVVLARSEMFFENEWIEWDTGLLSPYEPRPKARATVLYIWFVDEGVDRSTAMFETRRLVVDEDGNHVVDEDGNWEWENIYLNFYDVMRRGVRTDFVLDLTASPPTVIDTDARWDELLEEYFINDGARRGFSLYRIIVG